MLSFDNDKSSPDPSGLHHTRNGPTASWATLRSMSMGYSADVASSSFLHCDGLVQDYSNSSALAMELLQSCTKPLICRFAKSFSNCQSMYMG